MARASRFVPGFIAALLWSALAALMATVTYTRGF
jgi:hypothetical protein